MRAAIGVDLGGTSIKYGLITEEGKLLKKISKPTGKSRGELRILKDIAEEIGRIQKEFTKKKGFVIGAGIGIPGPVLKDGYVENCVNLNFQNINPQEILEAMLGKMPIAVGNDANVAALGEMWQGSGRGFDSILIVTLGTGVGGGVVQERQIVYGSRGLAGELGHVVVKPDEKELCNCGKRGCLDQIASATGIVRMTERILRFTSAPSVLRDKPRLDAKMIVHAAKTGDALAYLSLDYCMSFLGKCLAEAGCILDPQVFVIGGGVSQAGSFLTDMIQRHYENNLSLTKRKTPIIPAQLGNDAGIYGAAKMIITQEKERMEKENAVRGESGILWRNSGTGDRSSKVSGGLK